MRRIKTYVLMVGVALSVTPIFHYSHAQQGNSNTQLLLDVQALRQEIAELRDMVERQNYQMKRLQRQIDESAQPNSVNRQGQLNGAYNSPNASYSQQANTYSQPTANEQGQIGAADQSTQGQSVIDQSSAVVESSIASSASVVAPADSAVQQGEFPQSNVDAPLAGPSQEADASTFYKPYPENQDLNTSSVASAAQQVGTYPPVVDRSFNTTKPEVPVTGQGVQSTTSSGQSNWRTSEPLDAANQAQQRPAAAQQTPAAVQLTSAAVQQVIADQQGQVSQQLSNGLDGQARSATPQLAGGVVSIPSLPTTESTTQVINAAQVPVPSSAAVTGAQPVLSANSAPLSQAVDQTQAQSIEGTQAANVAPAAVKPESDFYSEGISLLKQSQYEQAAVIFEQQLQAHPRGSLADGAHYWIAEAMFLNRKLDVAKSHLKTIISDYPQSSRVPNAMLKTAYIEQGQGNQIEARMLFQEIVTLYPQSDAAIAAKNQLASDS